MTRSDTLPLLVFATSTVEFHPDRLGGDDMFTAWQNDTYDARQDAAMWSALATDHYRATWIDTPWSVVPGGAVLFAVSFARRHGLDVLNVPPSLDAPTPDAVGDDVAA